MKIEKINDSQIRCILTKSELEKRDLKLSEISYGSAKVKKLFQDMMLLADVQCGFKADDLPLAIEVTPFRDYAAITVTKVEDPEELDTRYSRFAPGVDNQGGVLSELDKFFRAITAGAPMPDDDRMVPFGEGPFDDLPEEDNSDNAIMNIGNLSLKECENKYYYFDSLEELLTMASAIADYAIPKTTLYKKKHDNEQGGYLLEVDTKEDDLKETEEFCSFVSEYGSLAPTVETFPFYLTEHYETLIKDDAISFLKNLK